MTGQVREYPNSPRNQKNAEFTHKKALATLSNWGYIRKKFGFSNWLLRQDARRTTQLKEISLLVKMSICKGRQNSIYLGRPAPQKLQRPEPVFKNIVIEALKVQAYLQEVPTRTQIDAGQYFTVTRARISQLTRIVNNLPADFIEKMRECTDQNIIKRFSGKTLLRIAAKNENERRNEIEYLLGSKIY